ncbi:hypothetical protein C1645_819678 [Glomus cerebriforme]|uniref:Uncharacterized protein n=1 Tax=Glomus cerebriforme TaxID=658196 RepID=A0A397T7G6_9GLOM|nr:hypothetical protein C1645_819678 [Glomus cerebriforme]
MYKKNGMIFEAGKVKTVIDFYHAQYVKLGYKIAAEEDIEKTIKGLSDTHES